MKLHILILITLFITATSCTKDDNTQNPIDQLPPATQTGAQTFGCLINGEPFIADSFGSGAPSAFYQFVGGKYTLGINGSKRKISPIQSLKLSALDIEDFGEGSYSLIDYESGNFSGRYLIGGGLDLRSTTTNDNPGKLVITRFDKDGEYIISGTFEFTVKDKEGNTIKITNGRFDLKYTN